MFSIRALLLLVLFSPICNGMEIPVESFVILTTKRACDYCRKSKIKCDTNSPCGQCKKRNKNCERGEWIKRGPKKKRAIAPAMNLNNNLAYDGNEELLNYEFFTQECSFLELLNEANNNNNLPINTVHETSHMHNLNQDYQAPHYAEPINNNNYLEPTHQDSVNNQISTNENYNLIATIKPDKKDEFIDCLIRCNEALIAYTKCQAEMVKFLSDINNFR